eukprot:TRINITY_DN68164_c7_g3_i2.p2 TRINITY_DN68164_c7_g3~~TRINITY_DN68164_c7_g3_i2.p2  ORF type:complete len:604 (+),score=304.25 TRINITY_DN68164_c7_g3_i2:1051-2862(+)
MVMMMMRMGSKALLLVALAAVVTVAVAEPSVEEKARALASFRSKFGPDSAQTGGPCAVCVVLFGMLNQKALLENETPKKVLDDLCKNSENPVGHGICHIIDELATLVGLGKVDAHTSPDKLCAPLCTKTPTCQLFKQWPPASFTEGQRKKQPQSFVRTADDGVHRYNHGNNLGAPGGNFWKDFFHLLSFLLHGLKDNIEKVFDQHVPMAADDKDGDRHATATTFRGTSWRGRDCDDTKADVYPGRKTSNYPDTVDHNCNGIFGHDANGTSYEELYCSKTQQIGLSILGDSATAHFRIPPNLLTPKYLNDTTFDGIVHLVENEADWPECSWSTAWQNATNCPRSLLPIKSMYQRLRERNLCNHRDYQNIGVNGARTSSMMPPGIIESYQRNQTEDSPALVFFALIGNDVCNGHPGMSHMTTVPEFEANVLKSLSYLDTVLPAGSHVAFVPLADGTILWDTLHNHTHPIGVPYPDFYEYLICLGEAPCWGWMNPNETWRELTTQRAQNLSAVYPKIIAEQSYKHFDMDVLPADLTNKVIQKWVAEGHSAVDLIEPVDGFHPSTTANMLIADNVWKWIEQAHPTWLGDVNPFNDEIAKMFGNQGGY